MISDGKKTTTTKYDCIQFLFTPLIFVGSMEISLWMNILLNYYILASTGKKKTNLKHPQKKLYDLHKYLFFYRFLNNPEKIMGHAAFWGMTLIANNGTIFALAVFSQALNFLFLHYVER